jgi:hypothetical protein
MVRKTAPLALIAIAFVALAQVANARSKMISYDTVISRVAGMVSDSETQRLASRHGLQVLNVMWEDTGRWQGSSVGPNISDVTIEVEEKRGSAPPRLALMPVIRFPNFSDKTADLRLDKFYIKIGNQKKEGREEVITLREFLAHPSRYMSFPGRGHIKGGTLLAERDTHALVSAQAAFLPVPQGAKASFHPVIFNYQSTAKNPAVLTILATRQGTSMTIIDNARDTVTGGASWGQRLFFNAGGERAALTAERLSDVQERGTTSNGESASSLGDDANLLMLIQVPLKYAPRYRRFMAMGAGSAPAMSAPKSMAMERESRRDDMEVAVLGHGELEGPYTELDGLTIERDTRFPVRVTVQFYQATSTGMVSDASITKLARQISSVYEKGDYVGSLVVPSPSDTRRPTNWDGVSPPPPFVPGFPFFPGLWERYWHKERVGRIGISS